MGSTCDTTGTAYFTYPFSFPCFALNHGVWRDGNLQALSRRSPCHLASRRIQPMGGNDKRRVGDARTFFSLFFTVSWYLSGGISSDVPSIAPFTTAQDCGTQFFRMPSVPGIQEHDILSSIMLPQDGNDLMLLIPQLPPCPLFGTELLQCLWNQYSTLNSLCFEYFR